jgi:tubulin-specific chaperone A
MFNCGAPSHDAYTAHKLTLFASSSSSFSFFRLPSSFLFFYGCCSIRKEIASYQKEAAVQEAKIAGMESKGADTADVKKQQEVLGETQSMIPECEARLRDALADVEGILSGASAELAGSEMYAEAVAAVKELGGSIADNDEEDI